MKDVLPPRKGWWNYGYLWKLNFLLLAGILTETTYGYDGSMLNGLQSLTEWSEFFGNPTGGRLGVLNSATFIGSLAGLLIANPLCDYLGRRYPISIGSSLIILGAALGGAAQNFAMFLVGRLFIGVGLILCQVTSPMLIAEVAHPSQRARVASIYEPTWSLGSLAAAWITFGTFSLKSTWSWRIPTILQGVFSVIQLILSLFCPESPRWLVAKGRREEALEVIVQHHGSSDRNSPLVRFEMAEIEAAIEVDNFQKSSSWFDFFHTKGNRHRFFLVSIIGFMMSWQGNGL